MALDSSKTDPKLGLEIHKHLLSLGIETPTVAAPEGQTSSDQRKIIKDAFTDIMRALNLDLENDSLVDTPDRVAKMFVDEIFWGLSPDNFPKVATVSNNGVRYDEMVVENGITVLSSCEHHFVTIDGLATVAYIPNERVLGLSKMNRIVEYFARRPQIQERLAAQIHAAVSYITQSESVAVLIQARHYCVKQRGVEDPNSFTTTSKLSGAFRNPNNQARGEFMALATGRSAF